MAEAVSPFEGSPDGSLLLLLASGRTSAFHLPKQPGAVFYLYIPSSHPVSRRAQKQPVRTEEARVFPLVVTVHGSRRDAEILRNHWSSVAEENQFVVLAPLFAADLGVIGGVDNYKKLRFSPTGSRSDIIEYDRLLLDMVDYVSSSWGCISSARFLLSGFSGGAQFVHRFWYRHPERVSSICIAAPGAVDLLPPPPWPEIGSHARPLDVRVQLVVGSEDLLKRREHMLTLLENYSERGLNVKLTEVDGVGHHEAGLLEIMQSFVIDNLTRP